MSNEKVEQMVEEYRRLEKELEHIKGERKAVETELKGMGVNPDNLDEEIRKVEEEEQVLRKKLSGLIVKAEGLLEKCKKRMES